MQKSKKKGRKIEMENMCNCSSLGEVCLQLWGNCFAVVFCFSVSCSIRLSFVAGGASPDSNSSGEVRIEASLECNQRKARCSSGKAPSSAAQDTKAKQKQKKLMLMEMMQPNSTISDNNNSNQKLQQLLSVPWTKRTKFLLWNSRPALCEQRHK